jgi:hypothetical protein
MTMSTGARHLVISVDHLLLDLQSRDGILEELHQPFGRGEPHSGDRRSGRTEILSKGLYSPVAEHGREEIAYRAGPKQKWPGAYLPRFQTVSAVPPAEAAGVCHFNSFAVREVIIRF